MKHVSITTKELSQKLSKLFILSIFYVFRGPTCEQYNPVRRITGTLFSTATLLDSVTDYLPSSQIFLLFTDCYWK